MGKDNGNWLTEGKIMDMLLKSVGNLPVLSMEEEQDLAKRIKEAENEVERKYFKDELSIHNIKLVINIAKQVSPQAVERGYSYSFIDMVGDGFLGLDRAVDKFDYKKRFKFSTYASWWIRQGMLDAINKNKHHRGLPPQVIEDTKKMCEAQRRLEQDLGRSPSIDELAEEMEVGPEHLENLRYNARTNWGLNKEKYEDAEYLDFIPDPKQEAPDCQVYRRALKEELEAVVAELPEDEQEIITKRFELDGLPAATLEYIGRKKSVPGKG